MNLHIRRAIDALFAKAPGAAGAIAASTREVQGMGPWSATLGAFVPRQVNPHLYEALRESIGLLDGAIETLVTLDGIVRVEGDNAALVSEIEEFINTVPVNDLETGLQAFYASQGNECYEQGFNVGEWVPTRDGRDIARLRVADSKGVLFIRNEAGGLDAWYRAPAPKAVTSRQGTDAIETVLRSGQRAITPETLHGHGYQKLDAKRMLYVVHAPEADNPYGTSKIRSLEFVGQILLRIENAIGRSWERYGDPPLHLGYKTKAKVDEDELERRRGALQKGLADALKAKADGNSMDLVTAIGALDEIGIDVIGAAGIALTPAEPIKAIKEEFFAKLGVPAWLLGLDGGTGGDAERQSEMVLQASKTRWARRSPGLTQLVATMLRLRGRTWKRGDWRLVQDLPNLQDMMKIAQARFLTAQAEMVSGVRSGESLQGIDNNLRASRGAPHAKATRRKASDDDEHPAEPWAVDEEYLGRVERERTDEQVERWWRLADDVAGVLGFTASGRTITAAGGDEAWAFDSGTLGRLLALGERFTTDNSGADAPVLRAMWDAWVRGWSKSADALDASAVIADVEERVREALVQRGGERVRVAASRAYMQRVVGELAAGALDGQSPVTVALELQRRFKAGESDWERLTRTEMAMAHSDGQRELYRAEEVELYDFTTAGSGACPTCRALARGGPYRVDDPGAPTPGRDTHPNCRCALAPHV